MTTCSVEFHAVDLIRAAEGHMIQLRDAPITFEQFLDWCTDPNAVDMALQEKAECLRQAQEKPIKIKPGILQCKKYAGFWYL